MNILIIINYLSIQYEQEFEY